MYWSIPANTAVHGEMCCTDTDDDGDSRAAVVQRISFFFFNTTPTDGHSLPMPVLPLPNAQSLRR